MIVVVSGLPGSGKTTLARQLAAALDLTLIDKDDILDRLFETRGVGDEEWRRALSRESDRQLQSEAVASSGAVLSSFWHVAGMPPDSGTPTEWLARLPAPVVHIRCVCPVDIAARRFLARRRHPGHLDGETPYDRLLASLEALERLGPIHIGERIDVDTSEALEVDSLVRRVLAKN